MIACAETPLCLTAPTASRPHGRWLLPFSTRFKRINRTSPITRRGPGARAKRTNYWSVMAVTGANPKGIPREISPGVRIYPNPTEVARGAARFLVDYAWQAIARDGRFAVALSGGSTPR